jgi:hypothetical protein
VSRRVYICSYRIVCGGGWGAVWWQRWCTPPASHVRISDRASTCHDAVYLSPFFLVSLTYRGFVRTYGMEYLHKYAERNINSFNPTVVYVTFIFQPFYWVSFLIFSELSFFLYYYLSYCLFSSFIHYLPHLLFLFFFYVHFFFVFCYFSLYIFFLRHFLLFDVCLIVFPVKDKVALIERKIIVNHQSSTEQVNSNIKLLTCIRGGLPDTNFSRDTEGP